MKEAPVEQRLVFRLTLHGFKVLKLTTSGTSHTPDRLILRPKWSPGPPWVIELKRPGKTERRAQELTRDEWRERGVLVLDMVDTYAKVDELVLTLLDICERKRLRRCSSCGVLNRDARTIICVPPFNRQEHAWVDVT
jgi:hypothetical protein